jgi:hypothetical protein
MVYAAIGRYNKFHNTVSFYLPDNIPNSENFVLRLICHSSPRSRTVALAQSDEHRALEGGMRAVLDLDPFAERPER